MKHVFISYAHEDRQQAGALRTVLQWARKKTWLDTKFILAGDVITERIDRALRDAGAVVVLVTPDSVKSAPVAYEWAFAMGAGIPVIPVLLRKASLPMQLAPLRHIDLRRNSDGFPEVVHVLRQLDGREGGNAAAPVAAASSTPKLYARFELDDGKPVTRRGTYVMWVGIKDAPAKTPRVAFRITDHDDTVDDDRWTVAAHWPDFQGKVELCGDVYLTARGRASGKKWTAAGTLSEALRRYYRGRKVSKEMAAALHYIQSH